MDLYIARIKQGITDELKNTALRFCPFVMQLMEILFSCLTECNLVKLIVVCCPYRQIKREILSGKWSDILVYINIGTNIHGPMLILKLQKHG
jgi:hypothetical protein